MTEDKTTGLPRLSPEEQDKLYSEIKGTPLEAKAILQGILDPPNVRNYRHALKQFATKDADTMLVKSKAITFATRQEPVLVMGESGTGKELLANIIHGERHGNFVGVNVCAVTDTLFESELFGHVKGAFTGADKDRQGLISQANDGTLFLDEVGDMPLMLQAKLLRVIQNKKFRKVGSNVDEDVRCRIVAATHRSIPTMVKDNTFRLDLYERLQVFKLRIKPLRERLCDMELYVGVEFVTLLHTKMDCREFMFSGNVRQLMNLKQRYDVFGESEITEEDVK